MQSSLEFAFMFIGVVMCIRCIYMHMHISNYYMYKLMYFLLSLVFTICSFALIKKKIPFCRNNYKITYQTCRKRRINHFAIMYNMRYTWIFAIHWKLTNKHSCIINLKLYWINLITYAIIWNILCKIFNLHYSYAFMYLISVFAECDCVIFVHICFECKNMFIRITFRNCSDSVFFVLFFCVLLFHLQSNKFTWITHWK